VPRRVIEGAVLVVLGFYLFGHTLPRAWRTLNTDFPNYYLAAKLTREGVDPARAYEWIWLQLTSGWLDSCPSRLFPLSRFGL
jgi:hypothetical protein